MSSMRAVNLRRIAAQALKPPEPNRSFIRIRGSVTCTLVTGARPWTLHVFDGDWRVTEQAPDHVTTLKQLHAWAGERLAQLADEQEVAP